MYSFTFTGSLVVGDDLIDFGICDLTLVDLSEGGQRLVTVSAAEGAVVTWSIDDTGGAGSPVIEETDSAPLALASPTAFAVGDELVVTGLSGATYESMALATAAVDASGVGQALIALSMGDGVTMLDLGAGGTLLASVADTAATYASGVSQMAHAVVDGNSIVLAASASEGGLTAYHYDGTTLHAGDSIGTSDGTGLMVPTDLQTITLDGTTFALLAHAGGNSGGIAVMEVTDAGGLSPTDQILDTLGSRFGQVQSLAVAEVEGGALVLAGGGDDGLSLLALSADGTLSHLTAIEDTIAAGLTNVTDIAFDITGSSGRVWVTSEGDAGVSSFTIDLEGLGTILSGGQTGGAENDVIFASSGRDVLTGGTGADTFVITQDSRNIDVVTDFNVSTDRLDLSDWNFLYDAEGVTITVMRNGARIEYRDQILRLFSEDGSSLSPDAVRATIDLDVTRLPKLVEIEDRGTDQDDIIEGDWGIDRLHGGAGDDILFGFGGDDAFESDAGNDTIFGGSGTDSVTFAMAYDDVTFGEIDGVTITLSSAQGTDVISGVEVFHFSDRTLDFDALVAEQAPAPTMEVRGTEGDDRLEYTVASVSITGLDGADTILTGDGDDFIFGGTDNDMIQSGRGADHIEGGFGDDDIWGGGGEDVIVGNAGADTLRGGRECDTIFGGGDDDVLRGQKHADTLYGGSGNDNIKGGGGNDVHYGGGGDDFIKGGTRVDVLYGGAGRDILSGNSFEDALYGGGGDDMLRGGGHDDILDGGAGNDLLKGGSGADTFVFAQGDGSDVILDFETGIDTLQIAQEIANGSEDATIFLSQHAVQTSEGFLLDFGGGNDLLIEGVFDLTSLANSVDFI